MNVFRNDQVSCLISEVTGLEIGTVDLDIVATTVWNVVINRNKVRKNDLSDYVGVPEQCIDRALRNASEKMFNRLSPDDRHNQDLFKPLGANQILYVLAAAVILSGYGDFYGESPTLSELSTVRTLGEYIPPIQIRSKSAFKGLCTIIEFVAHHCRLDSQLSLRSFISQRYDVTSTPQRCKDVKVVCDALQEYQTVAAKALFGYVYYKPSEACMKLAQAAKGCIAT